jgi:hypothetical protein
VLLWLDQNRDHKNAYVCASIPIAGSGDDGGRGYGDLLDQDTETTTTVIGVPLPDDKLPHSKSAFETQSKLGLLGQ